MESKKTRREDTAWGDLAPTMGQITSGVRRVAKRERTKFGGRPAGWKRIAFDVPEGMAAKFEAARQRMPTDSVKLLGTAAVGTFVTLPEATQEALYEWAHHNELRPDRIDYGKVMALLLRMLHDMGADDLPPTESAPKSSPEDRAITHYVSRILDPEVTPPPGEKRSDKGGEKKRGMG